MSDMMGNGMKSELPALRSSDRVGDYAQAFRKGRELAREPAGAANALGGADPLALARRTVAALTPDQKVQAGRRAEILANIGFGLKGVAYARRRSVLAHLAPALARRGLDPATLAAFDPTNAHLDDQIATAIGISRLLAEPAPA